MLSGRLFFLGFYIISSCSNFSRLGIQVPSIVVTTQRVSLLSSPFKFVPLRIIVYQETVTVAHQEEHD